MALHLVNFAKGEHYLKIQEKQRKLLSPYFNSIFEYGEQFIYDSGYYERNKNVIDTSSTGWGYCGWKGEVILDVMSKVNDNDLVFYSDVSDEIYNYKFFDWLILRTNQMGGRFFNLNYYNHGQWTRRKCFQVMGCDTPEFWSHRQLEAGTIGLLKNEDNIKLLKEWSMWCQLPDSIIAKFGQHQDDNLEGFVDHRCDQSILTNLVIREGWETEYMENLRAYIKYNEHDNYMGLSKHTFVEK